MEASRGGPRTRLIVVDFLATLLVTFCIGVATALVLGACVVLVAGDAQGAELRKPAAARPAPAPRGLDELLLAHYFAAKYSGLVAVDRVAGTAAVDRCSTRVSRSADGRRARPCGKSS